ncbi:Sll7028 protein [hydrothermal vent metagenome]|uniref:Sll7028 protein n=1 Tax=hydrothermal vent metagenome TaxID=652676 RepID=A0A1W1CMH3_9ZZZZ
MTLQDKLTKAKARLMLDYPYFGTVVSSIPLEKNNDILTFTSDGTKMHYNSEYLEKLSLEEVGFVMANGAMHSVLKHYERLNGRTKWLWQTATDYVVNAMLVKNGMPLPEYAYFEEKFEGLYVEEVYAMLRAEMMDNSDASMEQESQQITNTEDDVPAENITMHEELNRNFDAEESNSDDNEEMKERLEQIFQKYKRQGNLPKAMELVVPEYFSYKIDWREFLYGYMATHVKSSYTFTPPNMKLLYRGIYLPSMHSDLLRIVVAIDTSGSVDEVLLSTFLGEVSSMMQQYPNYEIDLITADAKVQSVHTFLPGEPLVYELSGGGGTDFHPVFKYIEQHIDYPRLLIYFTDGEGIYPQEEVSYDVLWVMPEKKEVPFGELLIIGL